MQFVRCHTCNSPRTPLADIVRFATWAKPALRSSRFSKRVYPESLVGPTPPLVDTVRFVTWPTRPPQLTDFNASDRERYPPPYKECFVPLSSRCGISQSPPLKGSASPLTIDSGTGSDTICNSPRTPLADIVRFATWAKPAHFCHDPKPGLVAKGEFHLSKDYDLKLLALPRGELQSGWLLSPLDHQDRTEHHLRRELGVRSLKGLLPEYNGKQLTAPDPNKSKALWDSKDMWTVGGYNTSGSKTYGQSHIALEDGTFKNDNQKYNPDADGNPPDAERSSRGAQPGLEQKLDQMIIALAEASQKAEISHEATMGLKDEVTEVRRDNARLEGCWQAKPGASEEKISTQKSNKRPMANH
ncbi:hypothetical protein PanWU01x14_194380 [Parasponia andersonii]|uniref:Uncharacterized protein n=1 Tax=Parasponia andersonii TaxID=3476 RepID=A0A2P5C0M8_PARAD|nr:hypothetical protein PanWU01x14_194380 [Parasponia andersonii]